MCYDVVSLLPPPCEPPTAFLHTHPRRPAPAMQASAPQHPTCGATTFAVPYLDGETGCVRTFAAFVIESDGPILPESAAQIATTNAAVPMSKLHRGKSLRMAMDPRCFKGHCVTVHGARDTRLTSNDALYFFAKDIDEGWGPNAHVKVAWRLKYKRCRIDANTGYGDSAPFDYNVAESNKAASIVVLVALPSPHAGYDGSITFAPPPGLRIRLDPLHGDKQSFMRAWTAITGSDEELVVVDPALIDRAPAPAPAFCPCDGCADAVAAWGSATMFAERAVSLCGPCYVEYKRREARGENATPAPPSRVSPFVLALKRSDAPLNAEMACMTMTGTGLGGGLDFSFH